MTTNWAQVFGHDEWNWITRLGAGIHDPEEKREFWETIKAKKEADPAYSIYSDFPRDPAALEPPPASEDTAKRVCREVLAMLEAKGFGQKRKVVPFPRKRTQEQEDAALIIELGGHINTLCLWPRRKGSA